MSYDKKFKESVLRHLSHGHSQSSTAHLFGIGITTLKEWKKREESGQSLEAKIRVRKPKKIDPDKLREHIANHPDDYLREIAIFFCCTASAVHSALKRLNITRKKRRSPTVNAMKRHERPFGKNLASYRRNLLSMWMRLALSNISTALMGALSGERLLWEQSAARNLNGQAS